ncbi:MAG: biotin/lipoyl-binding protein, partial [Spirochaetaceae bacterium]|nr:biotin/lipoyl-binding protein [Spirochaetaceae bacterium]
MKALLKHVSRKSIHTGAVCAGLLILTLIAVSCNKSDAPAAPAAAEEAETRFAVNTLKVSEGTLDDYLEFGGDVVASSSVDVVPDASGRLAVLHVAVGDRVNRNQIIAEIDPSRPGMTYSLAPVRAPIEGTVTSLPVA